MKVAMCSTIKAYKLINDKDLLLLFHGGGGRIVYDSKDFYELIDEANGVASIGNIWRNTIKESGRKMEVFETDEDLKANGVL